MKSKEREKLVITAVKELFKANNWKFKSYFVHKLVDKLFFESTFYTYAKENKFHGWLSFKPYEIDNVFWDIIDEQGNKSYPQSFRAEAAFNVTPYCIINYEQSIQDIYKPEFEIVKTRLLIEEKVDEYSTTSTGEEFRNLLVKDEIKYSVGIITSLIWEKDYEQALSKIGEYKIAGINSGYVFEEGKDFFDLAKEYIQKTL